jgi:hypothetical protein
VLARRDEIGERLVAIAAQERRESRVLEGQREFRFERLAALDEILEHRDRAVEIARLGQDLRQESACVHVIGIELERSAHVLERLLGVLLLRVLLGHEEMCLRQRAIDERDLGIRGAGLLEQRESLLRAAGLRDHEDPARSQELGARPADALAAHDLARGRFLAAVRGVDLGRGRIDGRIVRSGLARLFDRTHRVGVVSVERRGARFEQ